MFALLEFARHPLSALAAQRASSVDESTAERAHDPYERQRSMRLAQLEAAGKCLARSGKHDNLRYWPSECGSRVLSEYRRRPRSSRAASHAS